VSSSGYQATANGGIPFVLRIVKKCFGTELATVVMCTSKAQLKQQRRHTLQQTCPMEWQQPVWQCIV